jgi:hypothetical protein
LRFIDLAQVGRKDIARSHDEVLENAGFVLETSRQ